MNMGDLKSFYFNLFWQAILNLIILTTYPYAYIFN